MASPRNVVGRRERNQGVSLVLVQERSGLEPACFKLPFL